MTERPDLEVRPAEPADWAAIWPIFRDVVAAGDTYTYPPDIGESAARAAWLHHGSDRQQTYVAVLGGAIVATALLHPNHPGLGDHVANAGWMVDPARAGQGIGRAFAEAVIAEARRQGYTAMQFNAVVATNERAIALWQSLGFQTVGTIPDAFRHPTNGPTALHIMHRHLAAGDP
ncbi:MAG: GNAT family N-acetyltransferase [Ilumatobacteraceae bacterium]